MLLNNQTCSLLPVLPIRCIPYPLTRSPAHPLTRLPLTRSARIARSNSTSENRLLRISFRMS